MSEDKKTTTDKSYVSPEGAKVNIDPQTIPGNNGAGVGKILWIIVAFALVALIAFYLSNNNTEEGGNDSVDTSVSIDKSYPDVVAVVNGEEVPKEELIESVANIGQQAQAQGVDISAPEIQDTIESQGLATLINTKLLLQAAAETGVAISNESVDAELGLVEAQLGGAEQMASQMAALNLTPEQVKEDIREQLIINEYIGTNIPEAELVVTEEEISNFYTELTAQGEGLPGLEEIAPQIEAQLAAEKQQLALSKLIDSLRSGAEIEERI